MWTQQPPTKNKHSLEWSDLISFYCQAFSIYANYLANLPNLEFPSGHLMIAMKTILIKVINSFLFSFFLSGASDFDAKLLAMMIHWRKRQRKCYQEIDTTKTGHMFKRVKEEAYFVGSACIHYASPQYRIVDGARARTHNSIRLSTLWFWWR